MLMSQTIGKGQDWTGGAWLFYWTLATIAGGVLGALLCKLLLPDHLLMLGFGPVIALTCPLLQWQVLRRNPAYNSNLIETRGYGSPGTEYALISCITAAMGWVMATVVSISIMRPLLEVSPPFRQNPYADLPTSLVFATIGFLMGLQISGAQWTWLTKRYIQGLSTFRVSSVQSLEQAAGTGRQARLPSLASPLRRRKIVKVGAAVGALAWSAGMFLQFHVMQLGIGPPEAVTYTETFTPPDKYVPETLEPVAAAVFMGTIVLISVIWAIGSGLVISNALASSASTEE